MNRSKSIRILLMGLLLGLPTWNWAAADVSPGDVIDKTNWQKAEGLLPEPMLNWVKNGDFVLNIEELNLNPSEFCSPAALKSKEGNVGKYEVDEGDGIIDVKTGKLPDFIEGMPFWKIDPNDPKACQKIMYNRVYNSYSVGHFLIPGRIIWVGGKGYEREVMMKYMQLNMDGYPPAKELKNPDNIERYQILTTTKPYDLVGIATMLWRYRGTRQDVNFAYAPAIRRVRRTSPANRSDAMLGSDCTLDDPAGFDGKVPAFEWKLTEQREALMPFMSADPERLVQNEMGEWEEIPDEVAMLVYGYETDGWQGAPWCPVNAVWVKRPVWVIEITPKDPYYNYGVSYLWVDPETSYGAYKVVNNRAGAHWKVVMQIYGWMESADKKVRRMSPRGGLAIDDVSRHASRTTTPVPGGPPFVVCEQCVDISHFSLAGFQKFCK